MAAFCRPFSIVEWCCARSGWTARIACFSLVWMATHKTVPKQWSTVEKSNGRRHRDAVNPLGINRGTCSHSWAHCVNKYSNRIITLHRVFVADWVEPASIITYIPIQQLLSTHCAIFKRKPKKRKWKANKQANGTGEREQKQETEEGRWKKYE